MLTPLILRNNINSSAPLRRQGECVQPRSDSLFHFTRSLDSLKGILQTGFLPRYSLEDATPLNVDYVAYPMVCFCDIPMQRISEHTAFYGEYGVGMTKSWGLKNGLSPLLYATPGSFLPRLANFLFDVSTPDSGTTDTEIELVSALKAHYFDLIPMIKPISGKMLVNGKPVEKDFSQESEWRYVPYHKAILFKHNYEEQREQRNAEMQASVLKFTPADVKYIFVKTDNEIPAIFDFIQNNLGAFPLNDLKILISRIVSLETLSRDL